MRGLLLARMAKTCQVLLDFRTESERQPLRSFSSQLDEAEAAMALNLEINITYW